MSDLWQAWHEWSSAVIAAPLLQELEGAAAAAHISVIRYVAELLEADMASRRLPKVQFAPKGARPPVLQLPEDPSENPATNESDDSFPYPAETYHAEV